MKIILDTNVIIAAFATRGLCSALFELCVDRFEVVLSEPILKEAAMHLKDKIKLPEAQCSLIDAYLRINCSVSDIDEPDPSACRDSNDLHVLGLAQHVSAHYIVTGDKDLLELVRYKDTRIITPREFWAVAKEHPPQMS
ncbi:MAG: putative toxin-antitoxin system toxin component, PIN family [Thermodesulfobacteriota bacterium]